MNSSHTHSQVLTVYILNSQNSRQLALEARQTGSQQQNGAQDQIPGLTPDRRWYSKIDSSIDTCITNSIISGTNLKWNPQDSRTCRKYPRRGEGPEQKANPYRRVRSPAIRQEFVLSFELIKFSSHSSVQVSFLVLFKMSIDRW